MSESLDLVFFNCKTRNLVLEKRTLTSQIQKSNYFDNRRRVSSQIFFISTTLDKASKGELSLAKESILQYGLNFIRCKGAKLWNQISVN